MVIEVSLQGVAVSADKTLKSDPNLDSYCIIIRNQQSGQAMMLNIWEGANNGLSWEQREEAKEFCAQPGKKRAVMIFGSKSYVNEEYSKDQLHDMGVKFTKSIKLKTDNNKWEASFNAETRELKAFSKGKQIKRDELFFTDKSDPEKLNTIKEIAAKYDDLLNFTQDNSLKIKRLLNKAVSSEESFKDTFKNLEKMRHNIGDLLSSKSHSAYYNSFKSKYIDKSRSDTAQKISKLKNTGEGGNEEQRELKRLFNQDALSNPRFTSTEQYFWNRLSRPLRTLGDLTNRKSVGSDPVMKELNSKISDLADSIKDFVNPNTKILLSESLKARSPRGLDQIDGQQL